jgi:hypothetical protein
MTHQNHWHDLGDDVHIAWWVQVDSDAVKLWRASLGQADIDAWCAAHGWNSDDVLADSVIVHGLNDGRVQVSADLVIRNNDGKPIAHEGHPVRTPVVVPYARPLPEGIAPVRRP